LHLQARRIHQSHKALHELRLGLRQLFPVGGWTTGRCVSKLCKMFPSPNGKRLTVNGDVAQRGSAVVLDIRVWRVEQADQDRNRSGVHELVTVFIW
jgi:hypothetical protein